MAEPAQVAFEPVKRVTVEATCKTAINVIIVNVMSVIEEGGHRGSRLNNCWAQTKRNTRAYAQQRTPALHIQEMGGSRQGRNTAGNYETVITYTQTSIECEGDIVTLVSHQSALS